MDPPIAPNPTTELTVDFGKRSDASVKILALHAWCAAAARLIRPTATHISVTKRQLTIGITHIAKINMLAFLEMYTEYPFFIKYDER